MKDEKKKSKIALLLLIIGLVIIGGVIYFYLFKKSSTFETYINKSFTYLEENLVNTLDSEGKITLSFNLNTNNQDMKDVVNLLNKVKVDSSYQIDFTNKKMNINLNSTYNNKELLKGNIYTENSYLYFNLNNITDKYYKSDKIEEYEEMFNLDMNTNDLKEYLNDYQEKLIDNLDKAEIREENVSLNNKNVLKSTLVITDELKKEMDLDSEDYDFTINKVILYTDNKNFVKLEIISDNNTITVDKNNNIYKVEFTEENKEPVKLDIDIKDNLVNVVAYLNDTDLSGNITFGFSKNKLAKFTSVDVKNATNFSDITEDEMNNILEKISTNEGIMALLDEIEKLGQTE
ncbi:MAG: hypothetical protein MR266_05300 [Erysipelotrichaceae bacterium]|nr:hypothetical protein [Erysipelotrichaceae bacterium]